MVKVTYLILPSDILARFRRREISPSEAGVCSAIYTGMVFYSKGDRQGYRDIRDIAHITGMKVSTANSALYYLKERRLLVDKGNSALYRWRFTFDPKKADVLCGNIHLHIPVKLARLDADWIYKLCVGVIWHYQRQYTNKKCYATNKTIGTMIGRSPRTISRLVQKLVKRRWVTMFVIKDGINYENYTRYMYVIGA